MNFINSKNENANTALFLALNWGYSTIVKELIETGPDLNSQDPASNTLLMHAIVQGKENIAMLLIDHSAKLDHQNCEERATALMMGTNRGLI